jgi:Barstar (barnase inhibitor)
VKNRVVRIDLDRIVDEPSFHAVFADAFGFPDFYGRNMHAWIDCMSCVGDPRSGMTAVHSEPGHVLVLHCLGAKSFAARCPDLYAALVECAAFVNWRRIEKGDEPVLALSFYA